MKVVIGPESRKDVGAIRDVVRRAFSHHRSVADLVELIRASPQYVPELALVARFSITIDLPEWAPPAAAQVFLLPAYNSTVRGKLAYPPAFAAIG